MDAISLTGAWIVLALSRQGSTAPPLFTDAERQAVYALWNTKGRYQVCLPDKVDQAGPWQVRLTVEGSQWLWRYNRARGLGKTPPTEDPGAVADDPASWGTWIDAKIAHDRWAAQESADAMNAEMKGLASPSDPPEPPDAGMEPPGLTALAGSPPAFARAAIPMEYKVTFPDGMELDYQDNVPVRAKYAYLRFAQGVMALGAALKNVPADQLSKLFSKAGLGDRERKVMCAVSSLEGGFEAVNTYDTGYLSVGFIQFATLSSGGGSLGPTLLEEKQDDPSSFQSDFRQYGVDVTPGGALDVVDPSTGAEVVGPDAVLKVVVDKRLTAVFEHAGRSSEGFQVAQIRSAAKQYLPGDDAVSFDVDGTTLSGKVSDFVRSEAGLATLMDRKVNTGKLDPLTSVAQKVAEEHHATSLGELAKYEREIVSQLAYRRDYLKDTTLGQPAG